MSGPTEEWQSRTADGIKYVIKIDNFRQMTRTFKTGQVIRSQTFYIGLSGFKIKIYPGGREDSDDNCVSVFLSNESKWGVKVSCSFRVKKNIQSFQEDGQYLPADKKVDWGFSNFANHNRFHKGDLLVGNGKLILVTDIKLLLEEMTEERIFNRQSTAQTVFAVRVAVEEHIRGFKEELEQQGSNHAEEMDDQKEEIFQLKQSINTLTNSVNRLNIRKTECPICREAATPPMRLMQCGQGHIICDTCVERAAREEEGVERCHCCRGGITGRPSHLEHLLGLV